MTVDPKGKEKESVFRFLRTSALIILLFLAVLTPMEFLLRGNILFYDKIKHQSDSIFVQKQQTIEWIFLGDSQVFYGIDPAAIPTRYNVHNFAFASEPIATTYFKIKHHIAKGYLSHLKKAWIVFDVSQLTKAREGLRFEFNYSDIYNERLLHDAEFRHTTTVKDWFRILIYNSYIVRSRTNLLRISKEIQDKEDSLTTFGFALRRSAMSEQDSTVDAETYVHHVENQLQPTLLDDNIYYYRRLITMLQERGVEITLIRMPLVYDHANDKALEQENKELRKIIQNNFGNIRFVNSSLLGIGLLHTDFFDKGHLNYTGAQKLAQAIGIYEKNLH